MNPSLSIPMVMVTPCPSRPRGVASLVLYQDGPFGLRLLFRYGCSSRRVPCSTMGTRRSSRGFSRSLSAGADQESVARLGGGLGKPMSTISLYKSISWGLME